MSKEMNEMRMNHRRGIVNNFAVAQNPRDPRPGGISHNETCKADMMGNRYRDGMTLDRALLRNRGTLLLVLRESYKSRRDKTNTNTTAKGQISS